MLKILIIVTVTFSISTCYGDDYDYIKALDQINPITPGMPPATNRCDAGCEQGELSNELIDKALFEQCAMDLCGAPKDSPNANILDFNFDQYVSDGVMKRFSEVEGELKEIVQAEIEKNNKLINAFKKHKADGKFNLDFTKWEDWEYEHMTYDVFDEHVEVEINKDLPQSKRLSIKVTYPKEVSETFKKALDAYAKRKRDKVENEFASGVFQSFYSMDEAKKILNEKWSSLWNLFTEEKKKNPDFMKENQEDLKIFEEIKEKVSKGTFKDIHELGSIAADLSNVNNSVLFAQTGTWPESTNYNECQDDDCHKGVQEYLGKIDFDKLYNSLDKENQKKTLIPDKLAYCKSELAMKGLKEYDSNEFQKQIPEVVNSFMNLVFKNYSEDSKNKFKSYLDNELNFNFEPQQSEGDIDKFINEIHDKFKTHKEGTPADINNDDKDSKYFIMEMLFKLRGNGPAPLRNMYLCNSGSSFVAWDAFATKEDGLGEAGPGVDPSKDNLFVSVFSCSHHQHGKGIVGHEMGHALSWAFADKKLSNLSLGKYAKLRKCATSLYTNGGIDEKPPGFFHEGDKYRTEEDTADLISFLAYPNKQIVYECVLLEPSSDGMKYNDVSLMNNLEMDSHSSPLLRVLQEAIHKKRELSKSCKDIVTKYKDKYRFTSCF